MKAHRPQMSFKSSRRASTQSPNPKLFKSTVSKFDETRQQSLKESVNLTLKKIFVDGVITSITRTEFKREHFQLAIERVGEIFREVVDCDRERYLKKLIEQYALLKAQFIERDRLLQKTEAELQAIVRVKTSEFETMASENLSLREKLSLQSKELSQLQLDFKNLEGQFVKRKDSVSKTMDESKRLTRKLSQHKSTLLNDDSSRTLEPKDKSEMGKKPTKKNNDDYKSKYRKYKTMTKSLRDKLVLFEEAVKEFENLNDLQRAKIRQLEESMPIIVQRETSPLVQKITDLESRLKSKEQKLELVVKERDDAESRLEELRDKLAKLENNFQIV